MCKAAVLVGTYVQDPEDPNSTFHYLWFQAWKVVQRQDPRRRAHGGHTWW